MFKVSIIGAAGTLGTAIAYEVLKNDKVTSLCLIDINQNLLQNHVMDFHNAYPKKEIITGEYSDLKESHIVVITAGIPNRNDVTDRNAFLKGNLKLIKEIGEKIQMYAPEAIIITTSNPVDILNYYLYQQFDFSRKQLIGYTLNDSLRFKWAIRTTLNIENHKVIDAPVLGEHGNSQVPIFSRVTCNGEQLSILPAQRKTIQEKISKWFTQFNALQINRTTGWTTAVGMGILINKLVETRLSNSICSVILDGEYGITGVSIGAPVLISSSGVHRVERWNLTEEELEAYCKSATFIKNTLQSEVGVG